LSVFGAYGNQWTKPFLLRYIAMMTNESPQKPYRTIFAPNSHQERIQNFETYWQYTLKNDGEMLEAEKTLALKQERLHRFQKEIVRSRRPLANPQLFYQNYVKMKDDPEGLDTKTILLTCIYKFARHEWTGIAAAWDTTPSFVEAKTVTEKISRYHLCEEFCHVRLFHEMFRTFHLEEVQWVPMSRFTRWLYGFFSKIPEKIMSGPAFLSELMGLTFYIHLDQLLDKVLADEPEAKTRIRELLHEIMVDELAHIGQRRNYMGRFSTWLSKKFFSTMVRAFWREIPEAKLLFDIPQMIKDGLAFDYGQVAPSLLARTWIPSYCQAG
jgi:hypothetical protein